MAAVASLCSHAYWFDFGQVVQTGTAQDVIEGYVRSLQSRNVNALGELKEREGNGRLRFKDMKLRDKDGNLVDTFVCGKSATIELVYSTDQPFTQSDDIVMSIGFYNLMGQPLFLCRSDLQGTWFKNLPTNGSVFCRIPKLPLPPGDFRVNLQCEVNGTVADWIRDARMITVIEGDFYGSGKFPSRARGDLLVDHVWLPPGVV